MRDIQLVRSLLTNKSVSFGGLISIRRSKSEKNLSETLERLVHPKYFLSQRACLGILRRSEKRGVILPEALRLALNVTANPPWKTTLSGHSSPVAMSSVDGRLIANQPEMDTLSQPSMPVEQGQNESLQLEMRRDSASQSFLPLLTEIVKGQTGETGETGDCSSLSNPTNKTVGQCQQLLQVCDSATQKEMNGKVESEKNLLEQSREQIQAPLLSVRRLTVTECERLQGFPDGWTLLMAPDTEL